MEICKAASVLNNFLEIKNIDIRTKLIYWEEEMLYQHLIILLEKNKLVSEWLPFVKKNESKLDEFSGIIKIISVNDKLKNIIENRFCLWKTKKMFMNADIL